MVMRAVLQTQNAVTVSLNIDQEQELSWTQPEIFLQKTKKKLYHNFTLTAPQLRCHTFCIKYTIQNLQIYLVIMVPAGQSSPKF